MKLVKISLAAALAAGALTTANAISMDEAMKDVDISGMLRYRYDTLNKDFVVKDPSGERNQDHYYRAQINFKAAIADNFKALVQFDYSSSDNGYTDNLSQTNKGFSLRELNLQYTNDAYATTVIAGRQQLNTIWTSTGVDGLVGTGIKVLNNSFDGTTLAAFVVDDYNWQDNPDFSPVLLDNDQNPTKTYLGNIYGAAAIGSYEMLGGTFNPQLWLAYANNTAFLYALDLAYTTTIFNDINWTLEGAFLGNSLDNDLEKVYGNLAGNGKFFGLRGSIEWNGFDASLGGLYYGSKDKVTMTVIDDQGSIESLVAGEEILYTDGSALNASAGRNMFGYITAGYTFNEVFRVGGDFVYGGTKTNDQATARIVGGDKMEAVARVSYKYSPKLNFSAYYSYVNVDNHNLDNDGNQDKVRLQALYTF